MYSYENIFIEYIDDVIATYTLSVFLSTTELETGRLPGTTRYNLRFWRAMGGSHCSMLGVPPRDRDLCYRLVLSLAAAKMLL